MDRIYNVPDTNLYLEITHGSRARLARTDIHEILHRAAVKWGRARPSSGQFPTDPPQLLAYGDVFLLAKNNEHTPKMTYAVAAKCASGLSKFIDIERRHVEHFTRIWMQDPDRERLIGIICLERNYYATPVNDSSTTDRPFCEQPLSSNATTWSFATSRKRAFSP